RGFSSEAARLPTLMRWQSNSREFGLFARMFAWERLGVALAGTTILTLLLLRIWRGDPLGLFAKTVAIGILALVVVGALEFWPPHLPPWLPRWLLQVAGVMVATPILLVVIYLAGTPRGQQPFWENHSRRSGFALLSTGGLLLAIVLALHAV